MSSRLSSSSLRVASSTSGQPRRVDSSARAMTASRDPGEGVIASADACLMSTMRSDYA